MSRIDVYELYRGRLLKSFWVDMQQALDFALASYLDVPDEAGVAVVLSSGRKEPIQTIGDVAELIAQGYSLVWRLVPDRTAPEAPSAPKNVRIAKKTIKLARTYADLDRVDGYPDLNAAIELAKALLRATGTKQPLDDHGVRRAVTGETISEEQICELQAHAEAAGDVRIATTCAAALRETLPAKRGLLREHCAAAYNRLVLEGRP